MNPVLRKDLLGLLRLKRVAAVQIVFVAVLALLVLATWPQGGVVGGSVAIEHASLVRTDDRLLVGLIVGQIAMLILFVPGIAAVALTSEKEQNTLEMLYASRLKPSQIITGKVYLAILYPLILLLSGLPFVALLSWRGDVQANDVIWAYSLLIVSALFLSMISLTVSALSRQSATSLVIAYALVLVLCGAVLVPAAIMLESQPDYWPQRILHYVRSTSPIAAVLSRFRPDAVHERSSAQAMFPLYGTFLVTAGAILVGCFSMVVMRLRNPPSTNDGFGATPALDEERTLGRRVMYLIDPKKTPPPFGRRNPVYSKERRTSSLSSGRWMIRIFYGALFLSLGLAIMSLYGGAEYPDLLRYVATVLVTFQLGLILLVVPSLTSAGVSSEIENGTFEMLRLSRLSGGQIFWGKFLPGLLPAMLPVIALLPAYAAIAFISPGKYLNYYQSLLPILLLAVLFCCIVGLLCSTFFHLTARATVMAYVIASVVFVLPIFAWIASGQQLSASLGARLGFFSPLVMALNLLPMPEGQLATGPNDYISLFLPHLYALGGLCVALIVLARFRLSALLRKG